MPPVGISNEDKRNQATYDYLTDIIGKGGGEAIHYYKLAEVCLALRKSSEAEEYINQAIAKKNTEATYFFLKAKILKDLGRDAEALIEAESASAMELDTPDFYTFIAGLYLDIDSISLANQYIEESMFIAPDWPENFYLKANTFLRQSNSIEAQKVLYSLPKPAKNSPEFYYLLSKSYLIQEGRLDSAIISVNKGLSLDETDPGLLFVKARTLQRLGRTDTALVIYEKILDKVPSEAVAGEMADIYLKAGNFTKAAEYFKRQIEETPLEKKFYFSAGYCYERFYENTLAQELYLKAKKTFPDEPEFSVLYDRMTARLESQYRSTSLPNN